MYRARLVLVTALTLGALALAAFLALIPSYAAVRITASASQDNGSAPTSQREDAFQLERSQFLINEVLPLIAATSSTMDVVEDALALRPSGVRITRVTYSGGAEEERIMLVGVGTREQVSAYRDALTGSGLFTGVAVPVSALVGSEESGFSVVLTGKF